MISDTDISDHLPIFYLSDYSTGGESTIEKPKFINNVTNPIIEQKKSEKRSTTDRTDYI